MTNAFTKTIIAATITVSTLAGVTGNASATSYGQSYGAQVAQNCYQQPVTITKYVKVYRYHQWVKVPQKVTEYQTVCEDYRAPAHAPTHGTHWGQKKGSQSTY